MSKVKRQLVAEQWLSDNIKLVLLSAAYVYSPSHANLSDIAAGIVATSGNLASKTNTGGLLDAANITFAGLTGAVATQAWLYKDTGTAGTSTLLIYINQGVGLPLTPTGADEIVEWLRALRCRLMSQ